MAEPAPLILDNAGLKLGDGATPTETLRELACVLNHIELSPDVSVTTLTTMCGERDYPGVVKWSLIATLYQSFDLDATEEILSEALLSDVPVAFEIIGYRDKAMSATNPKWTGKVIPQPYSPINGDAGDASTVELEWSVVGVPAKTTSGKATGATAGSPGTFTPPFSTTPANLAAMSAAPAVVASPMTAWTSGQHVVTADGNKCYWNSTTWTAGQAP